MAAARGWPRARGARPRSSSGAVPRRQAPAPASRRSRHRRPAPGRAGRARTPNPIRAPTRHRDRRPSAGEVAGDRQAKAGPRDTVVAGEPLEPLEDAGPVGSIDAAAVVADDEHRDRAVEAGHEVDRPTGRVNFKALPARFVRTCSTRRRSPMADRSRGGSSVAEPDIALDRDRQQARSDRPVDSATENGSRSSSSAPDVQARVSSSRSPTRSLIEPTMVRLRVRKSRSTVGSSTLPSRMNAR